MFGKYRIVSSLGTGNSSCVFLAEHRKLGAYRAVKCIQKTHTAASQFLLEAEILKNLKHPSIPLIYDIEEDETAYYIIEEYIQGQSLEAFMLHQDCISIDLMISIVLQICDVLQYLHDQKPYPVIHQDLKPEHIILCGKRVVLIDFGIAAYITSGGNTYQNFGTKGYAAPEKYQGISCDERTDVYGAGKILEFLAKKAAPEDFQILKPFLQKALAPSMEERYASAKAFAGDLKQILQNGDQKNTRKKQKEHLFQKIAVTGTQIRIGVTHIAIALTCFFNEQHRPCIYQECHESECMRLLAKEAGSMLTPEGLVARERFRGMPYYGEGIEKQYEPDCLYVQDYGTKLQDILEYDDAKIMFILGSRPWERQQTRILMEHLEFQKNMIFLCNYDDRIQAKQLAKEFHQRIYCFPLDTDPFSMTKEKRRFFQKLLTQEGW